MNNRLGRDRDDRRQDERSGSAAYDRHREDAEQRARRAQPYLEDDDGQSYDREFQRDGVRPLAGPDPAGPGSYGQREASRPGWYSRGHTGAYGSGGGGYHGGHAGGGYGGSTGTDYGRGSHGGYAGGEVGYGGNQGYGYDPGAAGRGRAYGGGYGAPTGGVPERRGGFAGKGPKGYTRTDDRIREDVCDRLSLDDDVDATEIEVRVQDGEVTLEGSVETRRMKHQAENLAEEVTGVKDVHNRLRVLKGFLNELKDKVSGNDEGHHANTGTKTTPGMTANGRA